MSPNVDDYPILTQNLERGNCCYVNTDFWLILRGLFQKKFPDFSLYSMECLRLKEIVDRNRRLGRILRRLGDYRNL